MIIVLSERCARNAMTVTVTAYGANRQLVIYHAAYGTNIFGSDGLTRQLPQLL